MGTVKGLHQVMLSDEMKTAFPGLNDSNTDPASDATAAYNCIAWAAEDTTRWWWPIPAPPFYWPETAPKAVTVPAFLAVFADLGYNPCDSAGLEAGYEKVALYVRAGVPTHAARQLSTGRWTSKIGQAEDIDHASLDCLEGDNYGGVFIILRRVAVPLLGPS